MARSSKDYYGFLGVEKKASFIAIRRAYLQKFKEWQVDQHMGEEEKYEKLLAELEQVYAVLSDEEKRKLYDQYGPSLAPDKVKKEEEEGMYAARAQLRNVRAHARSYKSYKRASYASAPRMASMYCMAAPMMAAAPSSSFSIGFSAGGAKDVKNFREKVEKGYLPEITDVTYEGIFYDYYFDTGKQEEKNEKLKERSQKEEDVKEEVSSKQLFSPDYSAAMTKKEYYMTVGLNSEIQEKDLKRYPLNVVICLDISGSMTDTFQSDNVSKAKIDVAKEAIVGLLTHLKKEDRVGFVVFNTKGILYESLAYATPQKKRSLKKQLQNVSANGGTNFEAGYKTSTLLFTPTILGNSSDYENRIIFLTDAMPNLGNRSKDDLFELTEDNASIDMRIHSTFVGVGLDFNSELIEHISKVRGCNYYSVNSSEEFIERMDKQFVFMVTPLVFNLKLELKSDKFAVHAIYGSGHKDGTEPESMEGSGELMKMTTLFPSATDEETGQVKGGIVLVELKKKEETKQTVRTEGQRGHNAAHETKEKEKESCEAEIELIASYEDRNGTAYQSRQVVSLFNEKSEDFFDNSGIRKGIILVKYVQLLHEIIASQSTMKLMPSNKQKMESFMAHFEREVEAIGDPSMAQEVKVINAFLKS